MDQLTFRPPLEAAKRIGSGKRVAAWAVGLLVFLAALAIALFLGLDAGRARWPLPGWVPSAVSNLLEGDAERSKGVAPTGPVLYYRDPDKPAYSPTPRRSADGRDFVPVNVGGDLSFDEPSGRAGASSAAADAGKQIRYYRHPMGLPDTSPVPKKDSMGMDYIPVFVGDEEDGSTLKMSPGKLQRTGVRSEPAAQRILKTAVKASGTVQLDERRKSVISLRFDAYIDKVENITTGSMVRQGQPLMQVYGPDLLAPAAQYLSAVNERTDATTLKNARRRLENFNVPESVIAQIDRTHEIPATLSWPSPRTGIVVERTAVDGMKAAAGEALFRLADISVVWVLADIPETDLPSIALGQAVTIKPQGSNRTYTGRVALIYPSINKETRTARLRVELPNPDGALLPDMYAAVEIATGSDTPVLTVSDTALIDSGDRKVVIIDKGGGKLEPKAVETGRRGNGLVEIKSGISNDELVVVSANFLIDAESNLKAALQGMTAPGEAK
jgi:Cu(I)/Ag(I) efflux system membrane fusion protein